MQDFLLGTYTRKGSQGIYKMSLHEEEKKMKDLELMEELSNPTYLDTSSDDSLLFSVLKADEKGGIASFKKNEGSNQYEQVDIHLQQGSAPCFVSYDEERQFLYTANYHTGAVSLFKTSEAGDLVFLDSVQHEGSSVHPNQESPHAHYIARTKDDRFLIACDLGTDEVITYAVEDNMLSLKHIFNAPSGTGPRHLTFHPFLDIAYLIGELNNQVLILEYKADGSFTLRQSVSLLPDNYIDENSGAAVRVSTDGLFLYGSNRGHNSIVVYQIDPRDGALEAIQWQPSFGDTPRDFNLDATERFILVGHQHSPDLTLFERDPKKGTLTMCQKNIYAPEVVCVHPLKN